MIKLANLNISMIAFITDIPINLQMTTLTRFQASMKKEIGSLEAQRCKIPVLSTATTLRSRPRIKIFKNITEIWWRIEILRSMILATNFQQLAKIHKANEMKPTFQKTLTPKWWANLNFWHNASKVFSALEFMKGSRRLITSSVAIPNSKKATN